MVIKNFTTMFWKKLESSSNLVLGFLQAQHGIIMILSTMVFFGLKQHAFIDGRAMILELQIVCFQKL